MNLIANLTAAWLNSLWAATALVVIVWATLKLARSRVNAATRSAIWWLVLASLVVLMAPRHTDRKPAPPQRQTAPIVGTSLPFQVAPPYVRQAEAPVEVPQSQTTNWPLLAAALWSANFLFRT